MLKQQCTLRSSTRPLVFSPLGEAATSTSASNTKSADDDDFSINDDSSTIGDSSLEELTFVEEELVRRRDSMIRSITIPKSTSSLSSTTVAMTESSSMSSSSECDDTVTLPPAIKQNSANEHVFVYPEFIPPQMKLSPSAPPRIMATHCPRVSSSKVNHIRSFTTGKAAIASTTRTPKVVPFVPKRSLKASPRSSSRCCAGCSSCATKDRQLKKQAQEIIQMKDLIQNLLGVMSNNAITPDATTTISSTSKSPKDDNDCINIENLQQKHQTQEEEDEDKNSDDQRSTEESSEKIPQHDLNDYKASQSSSSSFNTGITTSRCTEPERAPTPKMELYEKIRQRKTYRPPQESRTEASSCGGREEDNNKSKVRHVRMCIDKRWGYYSGPVWKPDTSLKGCVIRFDNGDIYLGGLYNYSFDGIGKHYPKETK